MSIETQNKKERDCRIDVLKGIAIIAVVFYHLCGDYIPFGYLGVDIFLVIGGFLTVKSMLKSIKNEKFSAWNFLKQRIIRLLPMLVIVSMISMIFGYFLMLPVMNNVSKYEPDTSLSAEISGKIDFGYPHNLKRIIGFSLYATGDFSLSVSVDGRDPIRYTFPVSNTPVFLPANLTGHSFDIKLTSLSSTNAQIFHLAAKTSLIEK